MARGFFGGIWYWVFQRPRFCCCLPVRAGVIIMAFINLVLSAFLSIIVWYEVASTPQLTGKERGSFVAVGVVETLLALLSVLGFVGAIVRKVTFVAAYCTALYIHFIINLGVAGYFLAQILHAAHSDAVQACRDAIQDPQAQDQCLNLLGVAKGLYAAIASILLVFELYGAIMATRYVHQVRSEKHDARRPLHMRGDSDVQRLIPPSYTAYSDPVTGTTLYDPYDEEHTHLRPMSTSLDNRASTLSHYSYTTGDETALFEARDKHSEMSDMNIMRYTDAEKGHERRTNGVPDTVTVGSSTPRTVQEEGSLTTLTGSHYTKLDAYTPVHSRDQL